MVVGSNYNLKQNNVQYSIFVIGNWLTYNLKKIHTPKAISERTSKN